MRCTDHGNAPGRWGGAALCLIVLAFANGCGSGDSEPIHIPDIEPGQTGDDETSTGQGDDNVAPGGDDAAFDDDTIGDDDATSGDDTADDAATDDDNDAAGNDDGGDDDSGADDTAGCEGAPGIDCPVFCGAGTFAAPECRGSEWHCPRGYTEVAAGSCGEAPVHGGGDDDTPPPRIDCDGDAGFLCARYCGSAEFSGALCDENGWRCPRGFQQVSPVDCAADAVGDPGGGPAGCDGPLDFVCRTGCDSAVFAGAICDDGAAWDCPDGYQRMAPNECGGLPPPGDDDATGDDDTAGDDDTDIGIGGGGDSNPGNDAIEPGGNTAAFVLRGRILTPDTIVDGELYFSGNQINCVAPSCAADYAHDAPTIIETDGVILPGMIDAHNHTQYNWLPRWVPPKLYANRYQWQGASSYKDFKAPYNDLQGELTCEMTKYGEVKSLIAGTTAMQGSPDRNCVNTLVRNVENYNGLPADRMRTYVPAIDSMKAPDAAKAAQQLKDGTTTAYMIHLAEGIDQKSRDEFATLKSLDLLQRGVNLIHGTALTETEFSAMAQAGARLVWSPFSNMTLYGDTTDVATAVSAGVLVSLAPDWSPSGTKNNLEELRYARQLNADKFGNAFTEQDFVAMVTANPATAMAVEQYIGRLEPGLRADVVILGGDRDAPYTAVIDAPVDQVRLVFIDGQPLYGNEYWMSVIGHSFCEPINVCGVAKRICVKSSESSINLLDESLQDIVDKLAAGYPDLDPLYNCGNEVRTP